MRHRTYMFSLPRAARAWPHANHGSRRVSTRRERTIGLRTVSLFSSHARRNPRALTRAVRPPTHFVRRPTAPGASSANRTTLAAGHTLSRTTQPRGNSLRRTRIASHIGTKARALSATVAWDVMFSRSSLVVRRSSRFVIRHVSSLEKGDLRLGSSTDGCHVGCTLRDVASPVKQK